MSTPRSKRPAKKPAAQIVSTLSRQLNPEFDRGFGEKNLRRMVQFAETFSDQEIVAPLRRQLGWTHFTMLIPRTDVCRIERRTRLA